jgi:hypothetical protein
MAVHLMTVSEYARHRGCDEKAVRKAIASGRISVIEKDGRKWIDPVVADIQWAQNTRARVGRDKAKAKDGAQGASQVPVATHAAPVDPKSLGGAVTAQDGGYLSYDQARVARENEELMLARLERQEREGSLTRAEDVARAVWTAFRLLRDTLMPLGRTVSGELVPLADRREIQKVIDEAMRKALVMFRDRALAELVAEHGHGEAAVMPEALKVDMMEDAGGGC